MNRQLIVALLVGIGVGQLGWFDPIFIPLVLAGPLAVGAFASARGFALLAVVLLWIAAGLTMLVSDWVVNHEDVAFHAVVTVLMAMLATGGWWIGSRFGGRRRLA
jgi:hypothetical protein